MTPWGVVVADPWTGTTRAYPPAVVYAWNWTDAAVIP